MDFDLGKMQQMLSQARDMQAQLDERLGAITVEADSGGGAVAVRMSGKKEVLKLTIAPAAAAAAAAADDLTMLEDLIVAAVNAASRKADDAHKAATTSMLGGMTLPGM
jgi:DNA-binding YbaB/EbfC family protein